MAPTLEDHERRIAALELAQSATGDAFTRLDRKVDRLTARVDALHHVTAELIAESERRMTGRINSMSDRIEGMSDRIEGMSDRIEGMSDRIEGMSDRIEGMSDRIEGMSGGIVSVERRFVDLLNERFDAVMEALDRFTNPPRD